MVLGILLGLMSGMLLASLAISGYLHNKNTYFTIKLAELSKKIEILDMFKEQTLVELNRLAFQTVESDTPKEELDKMLEKESKRFDEEYLDNLAPRGL